MKNFKDGFNDFKKGGNETGGRPKFGFAGGAGHKGGGNGSFGKPRFENRGGERSFNRGGERPSSEMFTATCSSCHKSCEVPFRPNGEKPVYCSACFGKMRDDADRGGDRNDTRREKPAPTFNQNSGPVREERSKDLEAIRIHLAKIELQLNRVLEFVNPPMPSPKVAKITPVETVTPDVSVEKVSKKTKSVKTETTPKAVKKVVAKKVVKKAVKKVVKKVAKK
jgi:CxxC-x17-CxxC domain-containing protein